MLRTLRLTAALLAGLAAPVLAQTTSTQGARPATPPTMPPPAAPTVSRPTAVPITMGKRIDINGASETDLASLPGIGPVTAKNIVAGRPWDDMTALVAKKAMTQATYDKNKDRLALANINSSSVADMAKTLPGIGDARARKIADGRPYAKPDDLVGKNVLTSAQFDKIKDLVTY